MSLSWKLGLATLIVVLLVEVQAQSLFQQTTESLCGRKLKCRDCIQVAGCGWCSQPDFEDAKRCFQVGVQSNSCKEPFIYYPVNSMTILENVTLTSISKGSTQGDGRGAYSSSYAQNYSSGSSYSAHSESESRNTMYGYGSQHGSQQSQSGSSYSARRESKFVQIYPQHVNIKLRPNEPYKLNLQYARAQDYPIDLYYLMDLSQSMKDDKDKLSTLGETLSFTMNQLTTNFRLGFGSFVDKVLMPFVSTIPNKLVSPCDKCAAPYGFRNHMSLTQNIDLFEVRTKYI